MLVAWWLSSQVCAQTVTTIDATTPGPSEGLEPGRYVRISVSDTGEGIAPEHLAHVFDPFFTTKPDGVGLGLVNAKSVVEQHGGTIALEPSAPHGTRVTITLPLTDGERHDG